MALDLFKAGIHLGSVVRCNGGAVYCYTASGEALGTFATIDAAAVALAARAGIEAAA